jgi:hypothetical protein
MILFFVIFIFLVYNQTMAEAHCALGDISTLIDLFRNYTKLFTIHTNSTSLVLKLVEVRYNVLKEDIIHLSSYIWNRQASVH